jgi:hypothetical protein
LLEPVRPTGAAEPKALCCSGILRTASRDILLRFVNGRPVSHVTTAVLAWVGARLARERKPVLVRIWDNASWPRSQEVRAWGRQPNPQVKRDGGGRLRTWRWPLKSPWLTPIEPYGVHSQRAIVEPERVLSAAEVMSRVYSYLGAEQVAPLTQKVA